MSKILHLGITGGIGSGKSYCAQLFHQLGIPVYSSDDRAKILMIENPKVKSALIQHFGSSVYLTDGQLNKPFLRQMVFHQPEQRNQINAIVHPAVANDYEAWKIRQKAPFSLKESALIHPNHQLSTLDGFILVTAPQAIKIMRLIRRDGQNPKAILNKMQTQSQDRDWLPYVDYVIDNSGQVNLLPQILRIYHEIINRSKS